MAARLGRSTSLGERAETAFAERSARADRLSAARERGETLSIDIAQDPHNLLMMSRYAEAYGGTSAAARTLLDAELARQALSPTPSESVNAALPWKSEQLRDQFDLQSDKLRLQAPIDSASAGALAAVRSQATPTPRVEPVPSQGQAIRQTINAVAESHRQDKAARDRLFEERSGAGNASGDVLKSQKSLVKQTARQVAADADATVTGTAAELQKLLKREP